MEKTVVLTMINGSEFEITHKFDSKLSDDERLKEVVSFFEGFDFSFQETNKGLVALNASHITTISVIDKRKPTDFKDYLPK